MRGTTLSFVTVCLLASLAAPVARGCEATTLSQATNRAAEKIGRGHPLAALSCYREFSETAAFDIADVNVQERFLSEYLDHCRNLAEHERDRKLRKTYLQEAHDVANQYIEWYAACRPTAARPTVHVRAVMYYLGDSNVSLKQPARVPIDYERLAARLPGSFGTQAIELWDETLLTVPGATRYLNYLQANELAARSSAYRHRWEAFRKFLQRIEHAPETATIARDYLRHVHAILDT